MDGMLDLGQEDNKIDNKSMVLTATHCNCYGFKYPVHFQWILRWNVRCRNYYTYHT